MEQIQIGSRGQLFIFHDLSDCPTHVYTMIGNNYIFVVDTYLGPSYIQPVLNYLKEFQNGRKLIVINTHYDWDHIWGNSAFPGAMFIAHEFFTKELRQHFEEQLENNRQYIRDEIRMPFPNITFSQKLTFMGEGVEILYTPGHTGDSISVYDSKDEVLIVGDNVEQPTPHETDVPREVFIKTLKTYLEYPFSYLIAGHYWAEYDLMIRENIATMSQMKS
ncbi:MAG TPA: MBL fold metallo-hydrolase [Candidatus Cloacimonadota bacterium]|nr:MBL fold metallo-hydrolase [Candidatus Cloacimonadota bacterium]